MGRLHRRHLTNGLRRNHGNERGHEGGLRALVQNYNPPAAEKIQAAIAAGKVMRRIIARRYSGPL
jgi:hypothetical protein